MFCVLLKLIEDIREENVLAGRQLLNVISEGFSDPASECLAAVYKLVFKTGIHLVFSF